MREIKFRGKDLIHNLWIYGGIAVDRNNNIVILPKEWNKGGCVDEKTVGQFTGLYDAKGNEIYEGDIIQSLEFPNIKHIVEHNDSEASYYAVRINEDTGTSLQYECRIYQKWIDECPKIVIGNIHDNKELLKGGNNE